MRIELLALYGGPDQVMTVTSGLASVLGLLLLFWNKVVGIFFKVVRKFSRSGIPVTSLHTCESDSVTPRSRNAAASSGELNIPCSAIRNRKCQA